MITVVVQFQSDVSVFTRKVEYIDCFPVRRYLAVNTNGVESM